MYVLMKFGHTISNKRMLIAPDCVKYCACNPRFSLLLGGVWKQQHLQLKLELYPLFTDRMHHYTPEKWLHNRIIHPSDVSKQSKKLARLIRPAHNIYGKGWMKNNICDVIKQNESKLANTVFKIHLNKATSFFSFLLFFQSFNRTHFTISMGFHQIKA